MINNLLLNAIRHNTNNGKINISIMSESLIIFNTGKAGKLSEEKLCSNFSKTNTSKQGNGLVMGNIKKLLTSTAGLFHILILKTTILLKCNS